VVACGNTLEDVPMTHALTTLQLSGPHTQIHEVLLSNAQNISFSGAGDEKVTYLQTEAKVM
jgi:hypothetical protein